MKMGRIAAWDRCLSNKSMNCILSIFIIQFFFALFFGSFCFLIYMCIIWTFRPEMCICSPIQLVRQRQRIDIFVLWISEKHLRKMMSLVFIVFLPARFSSILSVSVLIAFILALVLERKMKWRSKMLETQRHNTTTMHSTF